jgi:hypothetical protein
MRSLREAAHKSRGAIVGGQRGYGLTRGVPLDDVQAVINRHLSQSRQMRERAMEIDRVRHRSGAVGVLGGAA